MRVSQASIYRMLAERSPMSIADLAVSHVVTIDPDDPFEAPFRVPRSQRYIERKAQRLVRRIAFGLHFLVGSKYVEVNENIDIKNVNTGIEAILTPYGRSSADRFQRQENNWMEDLYLPRPPGI